MSSSYTVADCKSLVKTLVRGVKAITWKFATFKVFVKSVVNNSMFIVDEFSLVAILYYNPLSTLCDLNLV